MLDEKKAMTFTEYSVFGDRKSIIADVTLVARVKLLTPFIVEL
jgi:hypothetical protein